MQLPDGFGGIEIQSIALEPAFGDPSKLDAEVQGYSATREFCIPFPTETDADLDAFRAGMGELLDDFGLDYDAEALAQAAGANEVSEIAEVAVFTSYPREVLEAAEEHVEGRRERPLPVTVVLDALTGLPIRSERVVEIPRMPATTVDVVYADGEAVVTAENAVQGRQERAFPFPEGGLDLYQLHHSLAFLPLAPGFRQELALFDLEPSLSFTMEGSLSSASSSSRVVLAPVYSRATVEVLGTEAIEHGGEAVEAYAVRVRFEGDPEQLPSLRRVVDATDAWPLEATYYLRAEAPHTLVRADFGSGVGLWAR